MIANTSILCPACQGALASGGALTAAEQPDVRASARGASPRTRRELQCARCGRVQRVIDRFLDLRRTPERDVAPLPFGVGDLAPGIEAQALGLSFRDGVERELLSLSDEHADRMMQILRESRGAWFSLLHACNGELLFLGNSLSGTVTPLAAAGFRVTALDPSLERARFARYRNDHDSPGGVEILLGGDSERLPFADRSFDVVVQESGIGGVEPLFAHELGECQRVCARELVLIADNRFAYKRSSGRRNDFRIPGPLEFASVALRNERGERTLGGYRRLLNTHGFAAPRAFALYPHAEDFTHVVALDARLPALTIGPKERKNRLKLAGRALGLFPLFTPSFALIAERTERASTSGTANAPRVSRPSPSSAARFATRVEQMLAEIAERIGEPVPKLEQLVGTRGNTAILHTSLPDSNDDDERGRWTLHLPLCPKNVPQVERHFKSLELLRARFPNFPVPQPLLHSSAAGFWQSCERRARGWTAPQLSGDRLRIARMLREASAHFATLIVRPPTPFTESEFEREVGARFDLVAQHAAVPTTIDELARMRAQVRERLLGCSIPRVLFHSDLRAKHVQVDEDGHVLGFLDWGTTELEGLPYFDLLHLVTHERKQEGGTSAGDCWRIIRDRSGLRDYEREVLESYTRSVGIDDETARAFESIYPVFVAAMAEKHWAYSRPRWLHKQFGL